LHEFLFVQPNEIVDFHTLLLHSTAP
jgi:hypothetical protein